MKRNSLFLLLPLAVSGVLGGCGASRYVPAAVSVHDTCHVYSHESDTLWIADSVIIDRTRDSVVYHREVRREYRHSAVRDTVYMVRRDTVFIIREAVRGDGGGGGFFATVGRWAMAFAVVAAVVAWRRRR